MRLSERSENHRICSLQFGQISNEIKIDLSLRRNQRQPAKILLDILKNQKVFIPYNLEYISYDFENTLSKNYPNIHFSFLPLYIQTEGAAGTLKITIEKYFETYQLK